MNRKTLKKLIIEQLKIVEEQNITINNKITRLLINYIINRIKSLNHTDQIYILNKISSDIQSYIENKES